MKTIDIGRICGGTTRFLSTRPSGREAAITLGVAAAFANGEDVTFIVPDNMIEISPSFTLGLFEVAVKQAGSADAVLQLLSIQAPDRIIASMVGAIRRGFVPADA